MATFGETSLLTARNSIESMTLGVKATPISSGTLTSMTIRGVSETSANNSHTVRGAVFQGTTLIAETALLSTITTSEADYVMNFSSGSITSGVEYTIVLSLTVGGGSVSVAYEATGGTAQNYAGDNIGSHSNSFAGAWLTWEETAGVERYSWYVTYAESGGGANVTEARKFGPQGFMRTLVNL